MNSRLRSLTRLAAVYQMVAYTDGLSLDRANTALREVELLLEEQSRLARSIHRAGRDAMVGEDRLEWLLSESQIELALWNRSNLELLGDRRKQLQQQAAELYRKSLQEHNQVDVLAEQARTAAKRASERREQAAADDRYLSRMRWLARRADLRVKSS